MVSHEFACQEVGRKKYHQGGNQHGISHLRSGSGANIDAIPEKGRIGDHGDQDHPEEIGPGIGNHLRIVGQQPENCISTQPGRAG